MSWYPDFGTAPIKCGRRRCKFVGYETDLAKKRVEIAGVNGEQAVCPLCGCENYTFMTERQRKIYKMEIKE